MANTRLTSCRFVEREVQRSSGSDPLRRRLVPMIGATSSLEIEENKNQMRVLGVDPAAAGPTGYGIVESDGPHCRIVNYGAFKASGKRTKNGQATVLREVHKLLSRLIEEFAPNVVAVENVFSALNVKTALRLAEVRGVVLLAAAQHGLEVHSYAPREIKATIAGHGHADKRQIQIMVRAILGMTATPEPADAADALAVALCHLQMERARRSFGLPDASSLPRPRNLATSGDSVHGGGLAPDACSVRVAGPTRGRAPRILSAP